MRFGAPVTLRIKNKEFQGQAAAEDGALLGQCLLLGLADGKGMAVDIKGDPAQFGLDLLGLIEEAHQGLVFLDRRAGLDQHFAEPPGEPLPCCCCLQVG